jgi:chemotaxis protein methyltransferase CheR
MVQTRLTKRLIAAEIPSFSEYVSYVFKASGKSELQHMINEITTNKTDFFREDVHFKFLADNVVGTINPLKIWSAGCSTGEEPYSLSTFLKNKGTDCKIYANDLSMQALEKAEEGIYSAERAQQIPPHILNIYFKRIGNQYKVKDIVKKDIKFSYINLMDDAYDLPYNFDVIFFRNVSIYFNIENQNKVLQKMARHLKPKGYLILGLSENIVGFDLPYMSLGLSIYQKTN